MIRGLRYVLSASGRGDAPYLRTIAVRVARLHHRDRWRHSLRRRLPRTNRIPIDRPIFVLGLQGGGTTLIARCLLRQRQVVSMSGNSDYWVATDELGFVRNRMSRLPSSLWSSSHRGDLDDPLFGVTHNSVYACDALLPSYRETAADANPEDAERFKRLIREHLLVYARDATCARFLDKTHTYTVKLGYLNALLEGCDPFFLLVLRNPFTFCFRAVRRKPPSWRVVPPYAHQLRLAAEHWENSYRLALAEGKKTGRFAAVRFEDFMSNPEATMRAVCEFVQLEFDRDLVPQPEHRIPFATLPSDTKWHPLREDQWRDQVPESDAAVISERCQPLAASLGYYYRVDSLPTDGSVLMASSAQHMDLSVVA